MGIFDGLSARYQAWSDKRAAKKESKKQAKAASAGAADHPSPSSAAAPSAAAASAPNAVSHPHLRQQQQVQPSEFDDDEELLDFSEAELEQHRQGQGHHPPQHRHSVPSLGQLQNQSSASSALAQGAPLAGPHRSASMFHAASSAPPLAGGGFRSSSPTSMPKPSAASQMSTPHYHQRGGGREAYPHSGLGSSPSSDIGSMMRIAGGGGAFGHSLHTTPQRNSAASFGPAGVPAEQKEGGHGSGEHDLFSDELDSGLQPPMGAGGAGGRQIYRSLFGSPSTSGAGIGADAPAASAMTEDEKFAELLQQQEYLSYMEESGEISHEDANALARATSQQREKDARRAARRRAKEVERAARVGSSGSASSSASSSAVPAAAAVPSGAGALPPFPPLSLQLPASLPSSPVHVDSPSVTPSPNPEEASGAAPSAAAIAAFREFRARAHQQMDGAAAHRPHALSASNSLSSLHHPPSSLHHSPHPHSGGGYAHPMRTQSNVEDRGLPPPFLHGIAHSSSSSSAQHHHHQHQPLSSNSPSRSLSYSHSMSSHQHPHTPNSASSSAHSFASPLPPHNATLAHSASASAAHPIQRASSLSRAELNSLPTFLYVPSPSSVLAKKELHAKEKAAAQAQKLEAERISAVAAATALLAQVTVTETLLVVTDPSSTAPASTDLAAPKAIAPASPVLTTLESTLLVESVTACTLSPSPDEEASSMDSCSICLDDYGREDKLRCLPCLHRYHSSCIDDWLSRSSVCPNCNVDVREAFN